ncbi:hypothetical protein [Streptomyces sp. NPDC094468]|uniref:hypothetical protein n=1 Tax=Streptomyces sp. NPDC094468 TaxID=3366066 RepID=UPI00381C1AA2
MSVLSALGLGLLASASAARFANRIRHHQMFGLSAIAFVLWGLDDLRHAHPITTLYDAAAAAAFAHMWWHGGGGDSTRRRLRQLRRRFTGVRRTAPSAA